MKKLIRISCIILIIGLCAGCNSVTYPRDILEESVIGLCKREYNIDVDVELINKTLAIYVPLESLLDISLGLTDNAQDKIQNVLLGASRVALSTDAEIQFYCVVAQDIRLPEIQMVIIKYVGDIKHAYYQSISRGEYFKRTLIDINENPQSKKEQAITEVFNKMKLDKEMQEKVLNDFFRSSPSSLEGIGYWNEKFYIKDIKLEEFLAQQIANRIKIGFREKEGLKKHLLKSISGKYTVENNKKYFDINFNAEGLLFYLDPAERESAEKEIFTDVVRAATNVIYGYKFHNFDLLRAVDDNLNIKLFLSKEEIYLFKKKKLPMDSILSGIMRF